MHVVASSTRSQETNAKKFNLPRTSCNQSKRLHKMFKNIKSISYDAKKPTKTTFGFCRIRRRQGVAFNPQASNGTTPRNISIGFLLNLKELTQLLTLLRAGLACVSSVTAQRSHITYPLPGKKLHKGDDVNHPDCPTTGGYLPRHPHLSS
jgi:hypothetical protein